MSLSLADFFILASVLQGLFIGLAIFCARFFRSRTNNYLAGFIVLLSSITFLGWQEFDSFWPDYLWSLMWEFLLPVLLFQYFLRVLNHPYLKAKWLPWLYAPFVFFLVVDVIIDLDYSFGLYTLPFAENNPYYDFYDSFLDTLALWWNALLIIWIFRLARADCSASPEKKRWLVRFSTAMLLLVVIWFLSDFIESRTGMEDPYAMIWLWMSLLFWWVAYAGVYQLRIVDERAEIHQLLSGKSTAKKVESAVASPNDYGTKLRRLMREEQLYRNPDLGRDLIAEHLGISAGYLSQVVQESLGEGFVEFVNGHRVEAAREMLADPDFDPYSLEAIGREAGFKSRSSFYETFKKLTGLTPGAFRKRRKAS